MSTPYDDPATEPHLPLRPAADLVPPRTPSTDGARRPDGAGGSGSRGPAEPAPVAPRAGWLLAAGVGAAVAVGIGVYGRLHEPTFFAVNVGGFSSGTSAKAWLATAAFALALVQLGSSLVMYGRFPRITAPAWTGTLHRWSGRVAVLLTVPVAIHCLYALGFQSGEPRVLVHSLFGCFFYGAFVAKMLLLQRSGSPKWSLPVFGGAVFTALVGLWLTSSLWFFTTSGLTF
ncbi:DUF6529 family protein [Pseudonocardia abyssalis]|uniref:DUF6529 family protein n=1 Tax=Pseudonocardia abyssalis TaxID=2792008 RepID=UPI001CF709A7|nr:DUF6529 family protein [Pseudonocardia abyssalis]